MDCLDKDINICRVSKGSAADLYAGSLPFWSWSFNYQSLLSLHVQMYAVKWLAMIFGFGWFKQAFGRWMLFSWGLEGLTTLASGGVTSARRRSICGLETRGVRKLRVCMAERAFVGFDGAIAVFLNILIGKRHYVFDYKPMIEVLSGQDLQFKRLLQAASPQFAWEVLLLQIQLQTQSPSMEQVMKLIQLYMLGVEVLENEDDQRYNYFNNKIHSLMMKKAVVEQLHRATTGRLPDNQTLAMIQKRDLEGRKSQLELQVYLQKEQYTLNSIKDIIKKEENHSNKRQEKIQHHIIGQHQALEERIRTRRLRSSSGSKGKIEEPPISPRVHKAAYRLNSELEKKPELPLPPHGRGRTQRR